LPNLTGALVRIWKSQTLFLLALLTAQAAAQGSNEPVVAFVTGTTLTLAAPSGQVVQKIDLKHPVYDFALSKDRRMLVEVAPDSPHGGNLSLVDLSSRTQTPVTDGYRYFRYLNERETEVYADPQFSPDGKNIVFGIHGNTNDDGDDAEENSGPFAVYNVASSKIRVLKSTAKIDEQGPCSEWNPMWSPDGKWILFNCENGAFITDAQGTTLRDLKLGTDGEALTSAVSWVGNGCVLYVQSHANSSTLVQERDGIRLFNLRTSQSQLSFVLPAVPKQSLTGLRESSDEAAIMQSSSGVAIETRDMLWTFPSIEQVFDGYHSRGAPAAHVLGGWRSTSIPHECE
jgi:Tol biopolymer transport system component